MTTIRTSKSKGAQFEYSVFDSLKPSMPNILLTKQLGFVSQYDLVDHTREIVIECKRHKAVSWNELLAWFLKLERVCPAMYKPYLMVKANRQPVLVMQRLIQNSHMVVLVEFEDTFNTPFLDRQNKKKKDIDTLEQ